MWSRELPGGWHLAGMAQLHPVVTGGDPVSESHALSRSENRITQPAAMLSFSSPGSRINLRLTPNFEPFTLASGELTFGAWGEGFIDARHPHTFLHEAMLSFNVPRDNEAGFSLSAGKGFVPFGTDDPMSRPVLKYPTNHHLSQILERWTLNAIASTGLLSLEAAIFAGAEPTGPWDLYNYRGFGNSRALRLTVRPTTGLELAASWADVVEDDHHDSQTLTNVAVRHERRLAAGDLYALLEASRSRTQDVANESYFSILGEGSFRAGAHMPYGRVELATRPEYTREGAAGTDGFFRYDHDDHPIGATRWLITSAGYGYAARTGMLALSPFVEVQYHRATAERGGIEPRELFGTGRFWMASLGIRIHLGGPPMRMGRYGVLDPMMSHARGDGGHGGHGGHGAHAAATETPVGGGGHSSLNR